MDYPGKVITKNQVTPTQTSASGNWTLDDAAAATKNNNWPVAGVPNPISKSLRFNSADSAYLNRTPAVAGNRKTWTWSGWVKRSVISTNQYLFSAFNTTNQNQTNIQFGGNVTDDLTVYSNTGGVQAAFIASTAVYRDVSSWYHIVVAWDTTQATAANRIKIYVNGSQVTALSQSSYPSQNYDGHINTAASHTIGATPSTLALFNGYLTEINFIDGQALTPSSFGMTNPQTGQWIPIKYSGTYGTNGFYLNFKDATSTTTLGYDYSGNANNWTTNNFSVTAGVGNDSLTDVPTPWIAYNTTGDVGGVVRGNYCTLNPLRNPNSATIADGNLSLTNGSSGTWRFAPATMAQSTGKQYIEINNTVSTATYGAFFLCTQAQYESANGAYPSSYVSGYSTQSGDTTGVVYAFAIDYDAGKIWISRNNTWYSGNPSAGTSPSNTFTANTPLFLYAGTYDGSIVYPNFGQRPFAYTPPAGFLSLCSTNLPTPTIGFGLTNQGDDYFDVTLYSGNATARSITNSGSMQPDFVWIKSRTDATNHTLFDSVRGTTKVLVSNLTNAESTDATSLTAFNSNGFSIGTSSNVNFGTNTYVAWQWRAAGSTVTNTAGSITSTVSANTTSGFSIVTFTGNGTNPSTVGHGLGIAPSMVIVKSRSATGDWWVYHQSIGATKTLFLSLTDAALTFSAAWNNTAPTSTVFTIGTASGLNVNNVTQVAYCFAAVAGYSAFGSYTGNGSADGPFAFCGFRPRYILIKRTTNADNWFIFDTARNSYNVANLLLYTNLANAEATFTSLDILSNGFKIRTSDAGFNASSNDYIYAAFAESPFKFANAR